MCREDGTMKFKDYIMNINKTNTLINALERSSKFNKTKKKTKIKEHVHALASCN